MREEIPDERIHYMQSRYPFLCARADESHWGYCTGWAGTEHSSSGTADAVRRDHHEWKTDIDL